MAPLHAYKHTPEDSGNSSSSEVWGVHKARVDNFNPASRATYDQRYISNDEFARDENPPMIIYVGGEWEITQGQLSSGQLHLMAEENEGALFYLEHRFYGHSMPKGDYSTANFQLLSSDQAMADLAGFIKMIKKQKQYKHSKVVLFGCSYSATLSTWMKHDYPDMITAVYATSGPLLAKEDMNEYLERASLVLGLLSKECANTLNAAVQQLQDLYEEEDGPHKVRKMFGYCTPRPSNEPYDKMVIFETIAAYFGNMVQTSMPTLQTECKKLLDTEGETEAEKLANYRRVSNDYCIHQDYKSTLSAYANTSTAQGSLRPFFYQQCTGFGWFVTTNNDNQDFGNVVTTDFYHKLCEDSFDKTVNAQTIAAAVAATNERYGGQNPTITNTAFAYGGLDPWQPMGLSDNINDDTAVFYIGSGGHCHDMFAPLASDGPDMVQAKIDLRAHIKNWLDE